MIEFRLPLDYRLSPGWLTPWVESVIGGMALARSCCACGRTSFVPERTCDCGCSEGVWQPLPGHATIMRRTCGADGSFGFVRFDGANTCTIVALEGFQTEHRRGRLIAPKGHLPKLILRPIPEKAAL